jgi:hypothetical protein
LYVCVFKIIVVIKYVMLYCFIRSSAFMMEVYIILNGKMNVKSKTICSV